MDDGSQSGSRRDHVKYDVQYLDDNNRDTYVDRGANHSQPQANDGTATMKVRR